MDEQSTIAKALRESDAYRAIKSRAVPPADSPNRPTLERLYRYAVSVRDRNPKALHFSIEGVRYDIVWEGYRLCVMHKDTNRVLVGAPGRRNE